jgi:hypothetical protein
MHLGIKLGKSSISGIEHCKNTVFGYMIDLIKSVALTHINILVHFSAFARFISSYLFERESF